jgi:hypothetical protein
MLFGKATGGYAVDPLVKRLTASQVEEDVDEYLGLLDAGASESKVQTFLGARSYFFNGVIRLWGYSSLYSKIRLGTQHEIDFVCFDTGSYGPEWRLIEIEVPNKRLFTKFGEPSAHLLHAIQQVRDWHDWIHKNPGILHLSSGTQGLHIQRQMAQSPYRGTWRPLVNNAGCYRRKRIKIGGLIVFGLPSF